MKTLVIHPDDRSTDFLKLIYEGKDYTIVTDHEVLQSRKRVAELIKSHDRIMMMGHGYPGGLFFTAINPEMVYLLREKECVCIWCNANMFVEKYGLKGFSTSMFCSEYSECFYVGVKDVKDGMVEISNEVFASIMSKYVDEDVNVIHQNVTQEYGILGEVNPVAMYNNDRLLLFQ